MLLRRLVEQIYLEQDAEPEIGKEAGGVEEFYKKMVEKTLDDSFEVNDTGLAYVKKVLDRLNKKAGKIGSAPLELNIISTRQEKYTNEETKQETVVKISTIKLSGKSPIIAGYEFIASIEHSQYGNIINVSPNSSVKTLPTEYRTATPTCDYCHTKRNRNNTFVLKNTQTGEFKRIGSNCLKNFMPDIDPANLLNYAECLSKALGALVGAEEMEEDDVRGGGGGGSRLHYYDAERFLVYICMAYILNGKRYTSSKAAKASMEAGHGLLLTTAQFAMNLMNFQWENEPFKNKWEDKMNSARPQAEELAKKVSEWKETKDWDAEMEKKPDMADYFHNMKIIAKSPAIQYKNAGYHASLLALYLREKEWGERVAQQKVAGAAKTYVGKIGERITFTGTVKKATSWPSDYGETYMYVFNDENGNDIVYYSSRDLNLEEGKTYKMMATVKKQQPSKYNQLPQTIVTRGKVLPS